MGLNGVPLRRVNQAYCIATSASVDVKGADVTKIDDAFFARTKKPKSKKDDEKPELKPERVAAQKAIDGVLVPIIKKTPLMDGYLKTLFSLSKADVPHKMKF